MTGSGYEQRAVLITADQQGTIEGVDELNQLFESGYTLMAPMHVRGGAILIVVDRGEEVEDGEEWKQRYAEEDD